MSKSIKIKDDTYHRLMELADYRDTFDDVIERLLKIYDMVHEVSDILGPSHYLKERPGGEKTAEKTP